MFYRVPAPSIGRRSGPAMPSRPAVATRMLVGAVMLALLLTAALPRQALADPPRNAREQAGGILIDFAEIDRDAGFLTIEGANFIDVLDVRLGGQSLSNCAYFETLIECLVDPTTLPDGTYDLVVEAGNGTVQYNNLSLAIGAVGPQGPVGPPGPQGEQGPPGTVDTTDPTFTGQVTINDTAWPSLETVSSSPVGTWLQLVNTSSSPENPYNWSLISTGVENGEGPGRFLVRDHSQLTNRMVIDGEGRIGVGIDQPTARFTVMRPTGTPLVARFQDNAIPSSAVDIRATDFRGEIQGVSGAAGNPADLVLNPGGGRVGIGVANPAHTLSVAGTIESTSGGIRFPDGSTQISAADLTDPTFTGKVSASQLELQDTSWPTLRTVSSAGVGTWHQLVNTSLGGRGWSLISTGANNGEGPGKFLVRDHTQSANRMVIDGEGRVGVGTDQPNSRLTVAGTIESTSGGIRFPDDSMQASAVRVVRKAITVDFGPELDTGGYASQKGCGLAGAKAGAALIVTPQPRDVDSIDDVNLNDFPYNIGWASVPLDDCYILIVQYLGSADDPAPVAVALTAMNP